MRFLIALVVALALVPPRCALAQYAPTQDSTLRGLAKVLVVVRGEGSNELTRVAMAELRRAGLRVARDSADVDLARDGVLNITFSSPQPRGPTLTMDVMQRAMLARTEQMLYMMTWYLEASSAGTDKDQSASALLTTGLNYFLSKWRAANGR